MMDISRKTITPHNCVLAFGIPTSKKEFFDDLTDPEAGFSKRFKGGWSQYDRQIIKATERILPVLSKWGVSIVSDMSLKGFADLFTCGRYDVVILFSHWENECIEFSDGLKNTSDIVARIPHEFCGLIDLCVCHPENMTFLLRRDRPNCLTKYVDRKATPSIWLHFYLVLFKRLHEQALTYLQALELTVEDFLAH